MAELKHAVGLRQLVPDTGTVKKSKTAKIATPAFKQYREPDGKFYFKLLDANARLLLQSQSFESPKDAAQTIFMLQHGGAAALAGLHSSVSIAAGISSRDLETALQFFAPENA